MRRAVPLGSRRPSRAPVRGVRLPPGSAAPSGGTPAFSTHPPPTFGRGDPQPVALLPHVRAFALWVGASPEVTLPRLTLGGASTNFERARISFGFPPGVAFEVLRGHLLPVPSSRSASASRGGWRKNSPSRATLRTNGTVEEFHNPRLPCAADGAEGTGRRCPRRTSNEHRPQPWIETGRFEVRGGAGGLAPTHPQETRTSGKQSRVGGRVEKAGAPPEGAARSEPFG